jgi:formamidopyrimidine-DNA glycosylase
VPELPEVDYAATLARRVAVGKTIRGVRVLHKAQRRTLPARQARRLQGDRVTAIVRRGKHQLFRLDSGRTLLVHFRMTGDWSVLINGRDRPPHARVALDFTDGSALALVDPRALATVTLHAPGVDPLPALGPDAIDPAFTAAHLEAQLARRRGPVKPALLDQAIVAGVGNIYASEALWYAHIDPRRRASALGRAELRQVVQGIRRALRKAMAHPERYYAPNGSGDHLRFNVYDRAGEPCRRCKTPVRRVTQSGRGSYFCPGCQR